MDKHIENARIERAYIGPEDHGIMTAHITVCGPGWGQGFGGWNSPTLRAIGKLVDVVGASDWSKLPGMMVRVRRDSAYGKIVAIGHILEDKWFTVQDWGL